MSSIRSGISRLFNKKAPGKSQAVKPSAAEKVKNSFNSSVDAEQNRKEAIASIKEEENDEDKVKDAPNPSNVHKAIPVKEDKGKQTSKPAPFSTPKDLAPATSSSLAPEIMYYTAYQETGSFSTQNKNPSFYIPNMIALSLAIDACHQLISTSTWINKIDTQYFPPAFYAYIAIVWHLRILKIRAAFGLNTLAGSQLISRIEKVQKIDDLPIPIILRPFFNALAAFHPTDKTLGPVFPFYPDNLGGSGTVDIDDLRFASTMRTPHIDSINGHGFLLSQMCVPILLDVIRYFLDADFSAVDMLTPATAGNNAVAQVDAPRYEQDGLFVPFRMNVHNTAPAPDRSRTLAGCTINRSDTQNSLTESAYMNGPGMTSRSLMDYERIKKVQNLWKGKAYNHLGPQLCATNEDLTTPQRYLRMSESFAWLSDLKDQCVVFSRYMGGSVSLGSLDVISTPKAIIFNDVKLNTDGRRPLYHRTGLKFYQQRLFAGTTQSLIFGENDVYDREISMSQGILTNARITIHMNYENGTTAYDYTCLPSSDGARIGPFFNRKIDNAGQIQQDGPYTTLITDTHPVVTQNKVQEMHRPFFNPRPE